MSLLKTLDRGRSESRGDGEQKEQLIELGSGVAICSLELKDKVLSLAVHLVRCACTFHRPARLINRPSHQITFGA